MPKRKGFPLFKILNNKLAIFTTIIYSFLLSISIFYSFKINSLKEFGYLKNKNLGIVEMNDFLIIAKYFIFILFFSTIILFLIRYIKIYPSKGFNVSIHKVALLFIIAWFPFLLVFYPSVGMNDTFYILHGLTGSSVQHPFYYCLFIYLPSKISLKLFNSMTYGLFLSTCLQMLFMSYSISYVINWLHNKLLNKYITYFLCFYFMFTPLIANYAIAAIKDTLFSIALMLWIPFLYDIFVEKKALFYDRTNKYYFCFLSFLTIATRNNGIYIFIALLIFIFYKCTNTRKQIIKYSLIIIIICILPNIYLSTFREKPQRFQEAVAIPLQQIARVITINDNLDFNQKSYLSQIMSIENFKKNYNPFSVDSIKWNNNFNRDYLQKTKKEFLETWLLVSLDNKQTYFEAWILQTFGFWSNKTQDWINQSRFGWSLTDDVLKKGVNPSENNKLKVSSINLPTNFKETLGNYMFKNADFINPGNCFWITIFIGLVLIIKDKTNCLIILLPSLLCWITLMLAVPAAFVYRYAFMYPLCLPFLIFIPFIDSKNKEFHNPNV